MASPTDPRDIQFEKTAGSCKTLVIDMHSALTDVEACLRQLDFSQLPFVEVTKIDDVRGVPYSPGIYFLIDAGTCCYIGASKNLHHSWNNCGYTFGGGTASPRQHGRMEDCLKRLEQTGRPIRLAWLLGVDEKYLTTAKMLAINLFKPAWNTRRGWA